MSNLVNEETGKSGYVLISTITKVIDEELSYGYAVIDNELTAVNVSRVGGRAIDISSAMLCSLQVLGVIDEQHAEGMECEIPFTEEELNTLSEILHIVIAFSSGDNSVDIVTKLKLWDDIAKKLGTGNEDIGIPVNGSYVIKELDYAAIG